MKNKFYSGQLFPFVLSLFIFIAAAILGWFKLRYGFNFIDEGWQMTEAWRITAGDDFFNDRLVGSGLRAGTLINSFIFRLYPEITLLGFRELQFFLTITALFLFSIALYQINKNFWHLPAVFSLFAFTGLDPIGMMSTLNYFTYPHLFLTFHLAFFLMALRQQSVFLKRLLLVTSGIFLWLISFSVLHMSLVVFSAVLLYVIFKIIKPESIDFNLRDLGYVMAPVVLSWLIFLGIYGGHFMKNILSDAECFLSSTTHQSGSIISVNWDVMKRAAITLPFLMIFLGSTRISKTAPLIGVSFITAIIMYFVIDTSCFGWMAPYYGGWYNGWVNRPLWFCALLSSSCFLLLCYFTFKIVKKKSWEPSELFSLVLLVPGIIVAVSGSAFSALGMLVALHASIPITAAMACVALSLDNIRKRTYLTQWILLILFFAPFYCTTAWSDWKFTFYDLAPEQVNAEIETGFGRGIKTNEIYKNLYDWIGRTSQTYSGKDDYIISYVSTPMVHMIARRKPALAISNIAFNELSDDYFDKLTDLMKQRKRKPKMAYVFEAMPILVPVSLENPVRIWQEKQFVLPSGDPISRYVSAHMTLVDSFTISNEAALVVRCFVDNGSVSNIPEHQLKFNPDSPTGNSSRMK